MVINKFTLENHTNELVIEIINDLEEDNFDLLSSSGDVNNIALIRLLYLSHNKVVEEINLLKGEFPSQTPSGDWTVTQIKAWLDQENIDYSGVTLKSELLDLIDG